MITKRNSNGAQLRHWARTLISSSVLLAAGCGGGSSSHDRASTGVFLDSPVAGITYTTPTMSGTTDAEGTFRYQPGETVTFTLGALELGQSSGAAQITLFDLAGISTPPATQAEFTTQLYTNGLPGPLQRVISTAQILQTLDTDANPDNGIEIDAAVAQLIPAGEIDLDAPYWETQVGGNIRDGLGLPGVLRATASAGLLSARPVRHAALALDHVLQQLDITLAIDTYTTSSRDTNNDGLMDWTRTLTFTPEGKVLRDDYDWEGDGAVDTIYEFVYNNNLERTLYTRDDDLDGTPEYTNASTYDAFGNLISNTAANGDGSNASSQTLTYDDMGRLTRREVINTSTHTIEHWIVDENGLRSTYDLDSDGDGTIDSRSLLSYAGGNRSDRWVLKELDSDLDGIIDGRQWREFDDRGRLLSNRADLDLDGTDEFLLIRTYDDFGIASIDDNRATNPNRQRWTRDTDGRQVRYENDRDYDGIYEYVVETTYNAAGERSYQTTDTDGDGAPDSISEWLYDADGNLVSGSTDTNADGTVDRHYGYEYDSQNRLVKQTYDNNNDGSPENVSEYSGWVQTGPAAWL